MIHAKLSDDAAVRIRATPETEALGLAGLSGLIVGETQPSASGVAVIGEPAADYALAVYFDARGEQLWFAPELLEPLGSPARARGAWAVNEAPHRTETPVTRLLGWLEQFLPRFG